MIKIPDVLGMKMPAAASLLDAAGVSYTTEFLRPLRRPVENGVQRVVQQKEMPDGTVQLSVCDVQEIGGEDDVTAD